MVSFGIGLLIIGRFGNVMLSDRQNLSYDQVLPVCGTPLHAPPALSGHK
jgi:hypothetical protein